WGGRQGPPSRPRDGRRLGGRAPPPPAMLRAEGRSAPAHPGAPRAYLPRDGETTQVTKDHTSAQRLRDEGRLTEEEAERHPQRSGRMRAGGDGDADPERDLSLRPATAGDRGMLCSDGLAGLVSVGDSDATEKGPGTAGEC